MKEQREPFKPSVVSTPWKDPEAIRNSSTPGFTLTDKERKKADEIILELDPNANDILVAEMNPENGMVLDEEGNTYERLSDDKKRIHVLKRRNLLL